MVKDQFLANCDKALGTYLREKPKTSLGDITVLAEHYIEAHGVGLIRHKSIKDINKLTKSQPRCCKCNRLGHVQKTVGVLHMMKRPSNAINVGGSVINLLIVVL